MDFLNFRHLSTLVIGFLWLKTDEFSQNQICSLHEAIAHIGSMLPSSAMLPYQFVHDQNGIVYCPAVFIAIRNCRGAARGWCVTIFGAALFTVHSSDQKKSLPRVRHGLDSMITGTNLYLIGNVIALGMLFHADLMCSSQRE